MEFTAEQIALWLDGEVEGENKFNATEVFGSIEAVKTVSDMLMPVSGEITEINELLEDEPEIINSDCYGKGWIIKAEASDLSQLDALLTAEQYIKLIG